MISGLTGPSDRIIRLSNWYERSALQTGVTELQHFKTLLSFLQL